MPSPEDSATFAEEMPNGKIHFLCTVLEKIV